MLKEIKLFGGWGVAIFSIIVFPVILQSQKEQINLKDERIKNLDAQVKDYQKRYDEVKQNLDRMVVYINQHPNLSKDEKLDGVIRNTIPLSVSNNK